MVIQLVTHIRFLKKIQLKASWCKILLNKSWRFSSNATLNRVNGYSVYNALVCLNFLKTKKIIFSLLYVQFTLFLTIKQIQKVIEKKKPYACSIYIYLAQYDKCAKCVACTVLRNSLLALKFANIEYSPPPSMT